MKKTLFGKWLYKESCIIYLAIHDKSQIKIIILLDHGTGKGMIPFPAMHHFHGDLTLTTHRYKGRIEWGARSFFQYLVSQRKSIANKLFQKKF